MGGDNKDKKEVSTHAPLAGSDDTTAQAATHHNVSTHAPLAGSDAFGEVTAMIDDVSTHAPLAGSDRRPIPSSWHRARFNPRSPCGERLVFYFRDQCERCFNPRSPCGERH